MNEGGEGKPYPSGAKESICVGKGHMHFLLCLQHCAPVKKPFLEKIFLDNIIDVRWEHETRYSLSELKPIVLDFHFLFVVHASSMFGFFVKKKKTNLNNFKIRIDFAFFCSKIITFPNITPRRTSVVSFIHSFKKKNWNWQKLQNLSTKHINLWNLQTTLKQA